VTGLNATDFSKFTLAGQIITMLLIQVGGLGVIVFTSIFAFTIFRGLSERSSFRKLLADILDTDQNVVKHFFKNVLMYTFIIEGVAALIMGAHQQWFVDPVVRDNINPWWWGLFHSVSAFNNSGFGLQSDNLVRYVTDPVINFTIAALIILGGIGYPVLIAIYGWSRRAVGINHSSMRKDLIGVASPFQIRVALVGTAILLAAGTFIPFFVELGNPIMQGYTIPQQLMIHFFHSVSTRTAGFNTIDLGALHITTLFLYMELMYIGANPAGTGGGIKIPTVAVLYGYLKDWFRRPGEPVQLFGRRISKFAVSHAVRLFFFSTIFIAGITFFICLIEREYLITPDPLFNFTKVLFEIFSAFGTVGLTMGYPGSVTSFSGIMAPMSKFLIAVTMLVGRVGPLTLLAALPWKRTYADEPQSEDFNDVEKIQIG
jgi:trk system potassium uptake protein TrkH